MCVGVPTGMHVGTQMNRNSYHAESADLSAANSSAETWP